MESEGTAEERRPGADFTSMTINTELLDRAH
jgi:hypothetical protein